ncbi:hypothetical protein [Thiolapillus sp.]|uniref:hypothetical protein n=4 Tax=Thiolapillus sp. TaxID=2017437 RepID=UPI003AF63D31
MPQPSWSPSTTQQLRKLVAAPYLAPNDWTPRSEAYFVFPLAQGTQGKQCGLAATGVYQPSLRSPWLAALAAPSPSTPAPTAVMIRCGSKWCCPAGDWWSATLAESGITASSIHIKITSRLPGWLAILPENWC